MPKIRQKDLNEMARISKICSHPQRLLILGILYSGEHDVKTICNLTGMKQTSVSQILARFRWQNIVDFKKKGRVNTYYFLNDPKIMAFMNALDEICNTGK